MAVKRGEATPLITVSPWMEPSPPGIASGLDSTYGIVAPLLAGFAATIVASVSTDPGASVAGYAVLTTAVFAFGLLVLGLEVGNQARSHWAAPADYLDWHPMAKQNDMAFEELRQQQVTNYAKWRWYQLRARRLYNSGLVAFLGTISLLVIPADVPRPIPDLVALHFAPVVVAVLLLAVETWWIVSTVRPSLPGRRFLVAPEGLAELPHLPEGFDKNAL